MQYINSSMQAGKIVANRRKALGITQRELAAKLGISQNRLSELEDRAEKLTLDKLLLALNVLGLEMFVGERDATTEPVKRGRKPA